MDKYLHFGTWKFLFKWLWWSIPVSIVTGSSVAAFLWLLDGATQIFQQQTWLLYLLPLGGVLIYGLYRWIDHSAEQGNNLVLQSITNPERKVSLWMAPLVLVGTLITHLLGGSAGREGTAVQMGASLSSSLWRGWQRVFQQKRGSSTVEERIFLLMGIAGGFGAVFGTPIAGAIFALEVIRSGKIRLDTFFPVLLSAVFSHFVCMQWGATHTHYEIRSIIFLPDGNWWEPAKIFFLVLLAGIGFGVAAQLFSRAVRFFKHWSRSLVSKEWMVPLVGGALIILLAQIPGNKSYLGLGVYSWEDGPVSITSSFTENGAAPLSWAWKILFTSITIGFGFKGGEVTPLFFIGATLGSAMAMALGLPVDFLAALGFVAVFAAATNTPVACTIMGAELFGSEYLLYFAGACFLAYIVSGKNSIYSAQEIQMPKVNV